MAEVDPVEAGQHRRPQRARAARVTAAAPPPPVARAPLEQAAVADGLGGDPPQLAPRGLGLPALEGREQQPAAEPVPLPAVLVRVALAQDRVAEEARGVGWQQHAGERRHLLRAGALRRDGEDAAHTVLVAEPIEQGDGVAAEREAVLVIGRRSSRPRPGERDVHAEEAALALPQLAVDGLGAEPRALLPAPSTRLVARGAVQHAQRALRAQEQRARVEARHHRRAVVQVDGALIAVRGRDVAPVGGEGGGDEPAAGVPPARAHELERGVEAVEQGPAPDGPGQPRAVARDRVDLRDRVDRAGFLVALGRVPVGGEDDSGSAEDRGSARRVRGEALRRSRRHPVVERAVGALMGEVLLDPRRQVVPRVQVPRERDERRAVAQPHLRVQRARTEPAHQARAAMELPAVGVERGAEERLQAVEGRVRDGIQGRGRGGGGRGWRAWRERRGGAERGEHPDQQCAAHAAIIAARPARNLAGHGAVPLIKDTRGTSNAQQAPLPSDANCTKPTFAACARRSMRADEATSGAAQMPAVRAARVAAGALRTASRRETSSAAWVRRVRK